MLQFASNFLSPDTTEIIRVFLTYVANNHSTSMMVAGITVFITSASAAVRSIQFTIGDMQGGLRYRGVIGFLFSILLACVFVVALYFGTIVLVTGRTFMEMLDDWLPFIDTSTAWNYLRFVIFGVIEFLLLWAVFAVTRQHRKDYHVFPGAIISTVNMVLVSILFSMFIGMSARYPLVYGSLASIILTMFWLYLSCISFYCGAVFNITLKTMKDPETCEKEVQRYRSMLTNNYIVKRLQRRPGKDGKNEAEKNP